MAIKKYLLVCEGPTDIEVLQAIAAASRHINGDSFEIAPLSPQADLTSGTYPRHGWTAVRDWCISHRPKLSSDVAHLNPILRPIVLRKNWKAIVAASNADGLIVQIDTDIADLINDLPSSFVNAGLSRKDYTKAAVLSWLSLNVYPTNSLHLLLSTYSTEAWILACHSPVDPIFSDLPLGFRYEDIHDVEARLIAKGFPHQIKNGKPKLKKNQSLYKSYASQIVTSLNEVRNRCEEANTFCKFLETS